MKKLSLALFLFVCAATQSSFAQNDPKAKTVLDGMTKKVKSLKTIKANFALNITGAKVKDSKKGKISLKGEKYHIELGGQEIICDTKTIWTYNKETKEVQVSNYNPSEQAMSPAKILTNSYEKEYRSKYAGERKANGKPCDVVELTPLGKESKTTKIELEIDKASSIVASGNIWEKNGNKIQYSITNVVSNSNIPDAFFVWDAKGHPGVEVVDLR